MIRILLLCSIFALGCSPTDELNGPVDPRIVAFFGGEAGWQNVAEAERVEIFRIGERQRNDKKSLDGVKHILSYPIIAGPVDLESTAADSVRTALSRADQYGWEFSNACMFVPGIVFRFHHKESSTDVLYCLDCGQLQVIHDGKGFGFEEYDDKTLLRAAQQSFPDDRALQRFSKR